VLSLVREGIAVLDLSGRPLYVNPTLRRRLGEEPRGRLLMQEIRRIAISQEAPRGGERPIRRARHAVEIDGQQHDLRVGLVPAGKESGDWLVVTIVGPPRRVFPSQEALRARFGLTRQEARIARLLARRTSTAEIARTLFISTHTVRNHIQRILQKLGVGSRAEIGSVLRRSPEDGLTDEGFEKR